MGTSFVKYQGFGFWTRDAFLESWLTTVVAEIQKLPVREPWQESLIGYWRVQATIDGGVMSVGLDEFLTDSGRKLFVLSVAKKALESCEPVGRRTGELFVELLAGRLKTTASSPINYFTDTSG